MRLKFSDFADWQKNDRAELNKLAQIISFGRAGLSAKS